MRQDREITAHKAQGGGVVVYIKNGINYTGRSDLAVNGVESVWIQVNRSKCKPFMVGSFYRAPDKDMEHFVEGLNQSLGLLDSDSFEIAILGDFNVDFSGVVSRSRSLMKQKFNSCLLSNNLQQIVKSPARITEHSRTIIDLICVNIEHKVVQMEVIETPLSDHSIVQYCVFKAGVPKVPPRMHE